METQTNTGPDYLLRIAETSLCILEAKNSVKSPFDGKEQARRYANSQQCRFAIYQWRTHYLWILNWKSYIHRHFSNTKRT